MSKIVMEGIFKEGYGLIPKTVMRSSLSGGVKLLYAYLCSYIGAGRTAWPGRARICEDLSISKDTFSKYLAELKREGYVVVTTQRINGKFKGNVYHMVLYPLNIKKEDSGENKEPHEEITETDINNVSDEPGGENYYSPWDEILGLEEEEPGPKASDTVELALGNGELPYPKKPDPVKPYLDKPDPVSSDTNNNSIFNNNNNIKQQQALYKQSVVVNEKLEDMENNDKYKKRRIYV